MSSSDAPSPTQEHDAPSVKHTPGSWLARTMVIAPETWAAVGDGELHVVRRGVDVIAAVWCGDDQDGEEAANARLIAAAPELLEALQDLVAFDGNNPDGGLYDYAGFGSEGSFQSAALTAALDRARAALLKAEGRS